MNYKFLFLVVSVMFYLGCEKTIPTNTMPTITLFSGGGTYFVGDTINLSAVVSDAEDNINDLNINWSSTSLDVNFFDQIQLLNGTVKAKAIFNAKGFYSVQLRVVDSKGDVNTMDVSIEIKEKLDSIEILDIYSYENEVGVFVSEYIPIYQRFELYRSTDSLGSYDLVCVVKNPENLSVFDTTSTKIGQTYFYKIDAYLSDDLKVQSKIVSHRQDLDVLNIGDYNIVKLKLDKERPYLYALDNKTSSLLFINTNTYKVEKTIPLLDSPMDFDIQKDNNKMYVLYENSNKVSIIDLVSQTKFKKIALTTNSNPNSYSSFEMLFDDKLGDLIVVNVSGITFYEVKNGNIIYQLNKGCRDMVSTPDKKFLYFVNDNSNLALFKLQIMNGNPEIIDETSLGTVSHSGEMCISGNGEFLIANKERRNTQDINTLLGTFVEDIYATNYDGSIAIGERNIWNANQYSNVHRLPMTVYLEERDVNAVISEGEDELIYVWSSDLQKIIVILL